MLNTILGLLFPEFCEICKSKIGSHTPHERFICKDCKSKIRVNQAPFCRRCSRSIPYEKDSCFECKGARSRLKRVWSWAVYDGIIKECIHMLKYNGKPFMLEPFKDDIIEFCLKHNVLMSIDLIAPVPVHESKLYKRQYNQAELIARIINRRFNIPIVSALAKTVNTPPQHNLRKRERFDNVKGSFSVFESDKIRGRDILLVDDIFTTGATINECASALKERGARDIYGFVLTRGS